MSDHTMPGDVVIARAGTGEINELRRKLEAYTRALEGLTPGGSEFVGDPEYCAAVVRGLRDGEHRALVVATRKLSDASLANAALRGALEVAAEYSGPSCPCCGADEDETCDSDCPYHPALALPADGLAEEVKAVLINARTWCPWDSGALADIDVLLAKLGGKT